MLIFHVQKKKTKKIMWEYFRKNMSVSTLKCCPCNEQHPQTKKRILFAELKK